MGASTTQSSMYSDDWAHAKNVALDSQNGFYNSNDEMGKEFWITTTFSEEKNYEVTKLIVKKIDHKCCYKRTMDGFIVSYYDGADWKKYEGGNVIKTGQLPEDPVDLERHIIFDPPIVAQKIKLTNPRKERSSNAAMGRIEFMTSGPKEAAKEDKATEPEGKKAIKDLASQVDQSSVWSSDWAGKNSALDSKTGFYNNDDDNGKEFWITTKFPEGALYDVSQFIIKKIDHKCCTKKTMDGFIISYYNGNEWTKYNDGQVVKTGQLPDDDVEKERTIEFNPPLRASQIKLTNPRNQRSTDNSMGRIDFIVNGPKEVEKKSAPATDVKKAIIDLKSRVS